MIFHLLGNVIMDIITLLNLQTISGLSLPDATSCGKSHLQ